MNNILVIDQGTHASRCIVFDTAGNIVAQEQQPLSTYRQGKRIIEQNPEKILASIYYCIDNLQKKGKLEGIEEAALITQRSTIIAWHKHTGKAISHAISWQDTRASALLTPLQASAHKIQQITGLPLSPHYGASKMEWLIENDAACNIAYQQDEIIIAPLACYLIEQLTGLTNAVVDHVNASRTQLLDINTLDWSNYMLDKFHLSPTCLPKLKPCLSDYGKFRHHDFTLKLVSGDQNAALFANGIPPSGTILINIGTGAFALKMTPALEKSHHLLNGLAVSHSDNKTFVQEGTVNGAGAALATLYSEINEEHLFEQLPLWLNMIQAPPIYINTISGLGSPWWDTTIADHFINADATEYDLPERSVAIIESIIFLLQNNIDELTDESSQNIIISGGLSRLDGLCQKLADISGLTVNRFENTEASATGAAWLLSHSENWKIKQADSCFKPEPNDALKSRYQTFTQHLISLTCRDDKKTVRTV